MLQKGPLWWAAHHRVHHRYSDTPDDPHSPRETSFWWAHVGWILSREHDGDAARADPRLARYPELAWLDRYWLRAAAGAVALLPGSAAGAALVWGFFVSTHAALPRHVHHQLAGHLFGSRRYRDDRRQPQQLALALITLGEGWHNNHHHYQSAANQGFFWWEVDATHYLLSALAWFGVVSGLRRVPAALLRAGRRAGGARRRSSAAGARPIT